MANKKRPIYAISGRYEIQGNHYDLSVYRVDNEFYASWHCEYCPTRGETDLVLDLILAKEAGQAALDVHHVESHAAEPQSPISDGGARHSVRSVSGTLPPMRLLRQLQPRFSLRTLLVMMALLCFWLWRQMEWIAERHHQFETMTVRDRSK